ncbi:fructosamine kinase family protein [Reichenbachiella ulvae]|uniref:Fructosamine kinase family protein n=1 Tax=Reichenbachiella ulvae TaxID=2980104 RepID=A0ABT3CVU1_9BACT|nr:fructosamine kinase family protein [Reichenbachiella ulvae]MCV9387719.1 fructosamine kinase family protein [Reichenbachiella ulvae]
MQSFFQSVIGEVFGVEPNESIPVHHVGGGCINQTGYFEFESQRYFLKWNEGVGDLFEKESRGLQLLGDAGVIKVPRVIGLGEVEGINYLCLEYLEPGRSSLRFWERFGEQLAGLHRNSSDQFGLDHDNHIGRLPQSNQWHSSWVDFFIKERLEPQLDMASGSGLVSARIRSQFDKLYNILPDLVPEEAPALLHGDLWSGNMMAAKGEVPAIFDPAVYYGHREAEMAFTKMFGGFDQQFYQSYHSSFPLQPGYEKRVQIFNLYPLLVHVNLFGSSYLSGIQQTLNYFTSD